MKGRRYVEIFEGAIKQLEQRGVAKDCFMDFTATPARISVPMAIMESISLGTVDRGYEFYWHLEHSKGVVNCVYMLHRFLVLVGEFSSEIDGSGIDDFEVMVDELTSWGDLRTTDEVIDRLRQLWGVIHSMSMSGRSLCIH